MKGLTELAELLLEKEVIFSEDLERIFGKRTADVLREEKESRLLKVNQPPSESEKSQVNNQPATGPDETENFSGDGSETPGQGHESKGSHTGSNNSQEL